MPVAFSLSTGQKAEKDHQQTYNLLMLHCTCHIANVYGFTVLKTRGRGVDR
jgi:hypothetical protein